jgi:hypothetical protein
LLVSSPFRLSSRVGRSGFTSLDCRLLVWSARRDAGDMDLSVGELRAGEVRVLAAGEDVRVAGDDLPTLLRAGDAADAGDTGRGLSPLTLRVLTLGSGGLSRDRSRYSLVSELRCDFPGVSPDVSFGESLIIRVSGTARTGLTSTCGCVFAGRITVCFTAFSIRDFSVRDTNTELGVTELSRDLRLLLDVELTDFFASTAGLILPSDLRLRSAVTRGVGVLVRPGFGVDSADFTFSAVVSAGAGAGADGCVNDDGLPLFRLAVTDLCCDEG